MSPFLEKNVEWPFTYVKFEWITKIRLRARGKEVSFSPKFRCRSSTSLALFAHALSKSLMVSLSPSLSYTLSLQLSWHYLSLTLSLTLSLSLTISLFTALFSLELLVWTHRVVEEDGGEERIRGRKMCEGEKEEKEKRNTITSRDHDINKGAFQFKKKKRSHFPFSVSKMGYL